MATVMPFFDPIYQWHTFYGFVPQDWAWNIAVDDANNVWLVGASSKTWVRGRNTPPIHAHLGMGGKS